MVLVAPTMQEAEADLRSVAAAKGWNEEIIEMAMMILVFGDADTVGERLQACMDTGIDGLTINLTGNGHHTDRIGLLGEIGLAATAKFEPPSPRRQAVQDRLRRGSRQLL